jgi:hypothetical protein
MWLGRRRTGATMSNGDKPQIIAMIHGRIDYEVNNETMTYIVHISYTSGDTLRIVTQGDDVAFAIREAIDELEEHTGLDAYVRKESTELYIVLIGVEEQEPCG